MDCQRYSVVLICLDSDVSKTLRRTEIQTRSESLALGYLASVLRQAGFTVKIFHFFDTQLMEYLDLILNCDSKIIGVQAYHTTWPAIKELCRLIKLRAPQIHITVGGFLATFNSEAVLMQEHYIDSVILGEGERTIVRLIQTIEEENTNLSLVPGLVYREKGTKNTICTKPQPVIDDLNSLPFPARDILFEDIKTGRPYVSPFVQTWRSCMAACPFYSSYTTEELQHRGYWRMRSVSNIVNEIEELLDTYPQVHSIYFSDCTFDDPGIIGKQKIRGLAEELLRRDLKASFGCRVRTDNWNATDQELIQLMRKAGFDSIYLEFESGIGGCYSGCNHPDDYIGSYCPWRDPKEISNCPLLGCACKSVCKQGENQYSLPTVFDHKIKTYELFKDSGMAVRFGFMMFNPYCAFEDLVERARFLHKIGEDYHPYAFATAQEVYKETPIFKRLEQEGMLEDSISPNFSFKYKFSDSRIGLVYRYAARLAGMEIIRNYENILLRIQEALPRLRNRSLFPVGNLLEMDICTLEQQLFEICGKMATICQGLFSLLLDYAAHHRDDDTVEQTFIDAIPHFEASVVTLKQEWIKLQMKARRKDIHLIW